MNRTSSALGLALLLATGCGSGDPSADPDSGMHDARLAEIDAALEPGTDAALDAPADPTVDAPASGPDADLVGTWWTLCRRESANWFGRNQLVVTNDSLTVTYRQYNGDPSCTDEERLAAVVTTVDSAWSLGSRDESPITLDRTIRSATMTVLDAELKAIWDGASGCGPHELDAEQDVTNRTCWGYWTPASGETYYEIIELYEDALALGRPSPGRDARTASTRHTVLDLGRVYSREGTSGGFIEGTLDGTLVRADRLPSSPGVDEQWLQISAAVNPIPPFDTWLIQLPNAVGTYTCEGTAIPTYLNYAFVDDTGATVLWDTEQSGGADCAITVSRSAAAVGDVIEGTFSGVLGDGMGNGHTVTGGSFRIRRDY